MTTEGAVIDDLRSECGFIIGAIDWVTNQLGYDLIGAIFDPLLGDFDAISGMRNDWTNLSNAYEAISADYARLVSDTSAAWTGSAAELAATHLENGIDAHDQQSEAALLIGEMLENLLDTVVVCAETVASLLSIVDELVLSWTLAKVAKEILTFGSGIRKVVSVVDDAIDTIRALSDLVPDIINALGALSAVMQAIADLLKVVGLAQSAGNQNKYDDVAGAGW